MGLLPAGSHHQPADSFRSDAVIGPTRLPAPSAFENGWRSYTAKTIMKSNRKPLPDARAVSTPKAS